MKLVRNLAIGLVLFLDWVDLLIAQQRPGPPKLPEGAAGKTARAVQPTSSVSDAAKQSTSTAVFLSPPDAMSWAAAAFGSRQSDSGTIDGWWPAAKPPFSFVYDGKPSETLLDGWRRKTEVRQLADRVVYLTSWTDPKTGLEASATTIAFKNFPAVDWVLRFKNTGPQDSPILEKVQALDVVLRTSAEQTLLLDQCNGDDCSLRSFLPTERALKPGETVGLAPAGGRSSNGTLPFFNLQCGEEGFFTAIGWTGQWSAAFHREASGATRLQAGMELTHLRLHPGEAIRTPRIMLLRWSGDRIDAHNTFRRLLLAHYLPKLDGRPLEPAIAAQTFNRTGGQGYWASEAGQIAAAAVNRDLGCDTLWLDAGWFEGNFPDGVGNWFPKTKEFPNGLRPVGDACRKQGLKFLVWYEPERVAKGTRLAQKRPEFMLPARKAAGAGGLFNLGDPQARRWLTDLLARQIADFNIHTYRNDFNIDPLPFWRQNDAPDRQGTTEIRYVEGLYAMWDELRARYPRMCLDDCASGGRRIDLEMVMRSVVQTRSDTACTPGRSEWDQCQTCGLNLYLPLHATIGWDVGAYECRSSATSGFCGEWDILNRSFPLDQARASIAEIKANRKYWYGDFYPLTPCTPAADAWMAWQLHRSDLDEGMVLAFRRKDCPQAALQVKLRRLKPEKSYTVTFIDDQRHSTVKTMSGRELASLALSLPAPRSSLVVRYALQGRQLPLSASHRFPINRALAQSAWSQVMPSSASVTTRVSSSAPSSGIEIFLAGCLPCIVPLSNSLRPSA
jgi:alpha-galactosidase